MSLESTRYALVITLVCTASCSAIATQGRAGPVYGSPGATGPQRSKSFPMVNVTGKTPADAEATIRQSGVTASVSIRDNYTCHDPSVVELHVCETSPRAGAATSSG